MLVYIYEQLSQNLHRYVPPRPSGSNQRHPVSQQRLHRPAAGHRLRHRLSRARAR
jgi:hypothetical protein